MLLETDQILEWRCQGQEEDMANVDGSLCEFKDDKTQGKEAVVAVCVFPCAYHSRGKLIIFPFQFKVLQIFALAVAVNIVISLLDICLKEVQH